MTKNTFPVAEVFGPVIQGEGPLLGRPTVFVRMGGCDYRCSWCDSLHAVLPEHKADWTRMTSAEILVKVLDLTTGKPGLITLSGGNPAIHRGLGELVEFANSNRFQVAIETQGSVAQPWFAALDYVILSPKPPSSGMATNWGNLRKCVEAANGAPTFLKVVVFDEADYGYARQVARMFPLLPMYLQAGNHTPPQSQGDGGVDVAGILDRLRWLSEKVCADHWYEARVTPQMHVLLYGNERGR